MIRLSGRALTPLLLVAVAAPLFDCASLEQIPYDACGNGAIEEASEECDTFPGLPTADVHRQCGAPGGAGQCRLLCNQKARTDPKDEKSEVALECPPGWGCSVDNICRRPVGEIKKEEKQEKRFFPPTDGVSAGVSSMLVGDFDGDRRKDIFGSSALGNTAGKGRFHYFGPNGVLTDQPVPLSAVVVSPLIRDLDRDGKDDLAFGFSYRFLGQVEGGIAVVQGQGDKAIVPKIFPSFLRPFFRGKIVPVAGNTPGNVSGFLAIGTGTLDAVNGTNPFTAVVALDESGVKYAKPIPGASPTIVGTPVAGFLFDESKVAPAKASYCGQVVVAYTNGGKAATDGGVTIFSPCTKDAPTDPTKTSYENAHDGVDVDLTALGNKRGALTGIHLADVDHDGDKDMLIGVRTGSDDSVFLALNSGTAFGPATAIAKIPQLPLASGDLNGDGLVDYVLPGGVLVSQTFCALPDGGICETDPDAGFDAGASAQGEDKIFGFFYPVRKPIAEKVWSVAAVADVNGDGIPDVIAGSNRQPDLDVLEGNHALTGGTLLRGAFMGTTSITTSGVVTQILTEDLDVDGIKDIAFVQQRVATDDPDNPVDCELAISYGRPFAMPPEASRPAGRAFGVNQIFTQTGAVAIGSSAPVKGKQLPTFSLAILFGSGERQPFAPLLFGETAGPRIVKRDDKERAWIPRTIVAGAAEVKDRIDFVALAEGIVRDKPNQPVSTDPHAYGVWQAKGTGNGTYATAQEVLRLDQLELAASRGLDILLQSRLADIDGDGVEEIVTLTPAGPTATIRIVRLGGKPEVDIDIADRAVTEESRNQLLDVDGDGRPDFVALMREPSTNNLTVTVYFNDGAGKFIVPGVPVQVPDNARAQGFALLTTHAADMSGTAKDVVKQLVIVSPQRLFMVKPNGRTFEPAVELTSLFGRNGIGYGTDVVTGDFDGDGVEDIAIADAGQIRIVRQRPRLQ